jgi:hypothetical protein
LIGFPLHRHSPACARASQTQSAMQPAISASGESLFEFAPRPLFLYNIADSIEFFAFNLNILIRLIE